MAMVLRKVSNVIGQTVRSWRPGFTYLAGDLVIPLTDNGRAYVCITGGTAAAVTEPTWPTTTGATVVDNTITWQEATIVDLGALNATPSATSGLGLFDGTDFGSIDTQVTYSSQPPVPGATEVMAYHPPATMKLNVIPRHTSWDLYVAQMESLAEAIAVPGTWLYKPDSATESRFIDTHSGKIAGVWRGQDRGYFKTNKLLEDKDGYPVVMDREPYIRGALLEAAGNSCSNATLLEDSNNDGRPERWVFDATTGVSAESISWPLRGHAFTLATGNTRKLQQGSFGVTPAKDSFTIAAAVGDIWSFSFYCSGSGGTATAIIEFLTAAGAVVGAGTFTGTGANLSGGPVQLLDAGGTLASAATRVSVVSTAAPATTALVRFTMQYANASGSNKSIVWGFAQGEKTGAVTAFRCGPETVRNDVSAEDNQRTPINGTVGAAGNVNAGLHRWLITFVTADGETAGDTAQQFTLSPGVASQINLTGIVFGSNRCTARKVYRTAAAAANNLANYKLVGTIADNTTTVFTDNIADAGLGALIPTTAIPNPPFEGHTWVYNPGNAPGPSQVRAQPGGTTTPQVVGVLFGARSVRDRDNLAEFVNSQRFAQRISAATLSNDTTWGIQSVSTPNIANGASGGTYVISTPATTATTPMLKRWRLAISPVDLASLLGAFDLYLVLSPSSTDTFAIQVKYGFGSSAEDPLPFSFDPVPIDGTNLTGAGGLNPFYVGTIFIPANAAGLFLEGWARFDAVGASIQWDSVELVPADEGQALLAVPGFQSDGAAPEVFTGARVTPSTTVTDLVQPTRPAGTTLPSTFRNNQIVLATTNDAVGIPPAAGTVLQAGRHIFTAAGDMYQADKSGTKLGELRVYNVTDNLLVASIPLKPKKGQTWTRFGGPGTTRVARAVIDVPAANVKAYQAEVIFTAATTAGWKMYLSKLRHEVVPYVGSGSVMMLDGEAGSAATLSTGLAPLDPLIAPRGFLDAPAGLFLLTCDLWDLPNLGADALLSSGDIAKHLMERSAVLGVNVAPRYAPL